MDNKKKIAFVVQRYGKEVNGGSEAYCKQVAEKLGQIYDVEILTTCAIDYVTWKNEYDEGIYEVDGLKVRRFKVDSAREQKKFDALTRKIVSNPEHTIAEEYHWAEEQGPNCPSLVKYIKENKDKYDCFIFMTYLYYTTFFGLQQVPEKSILISTAHDEFTIYFKMFYPFFHLPRAFVYLTEEEKDFVNKTFNNQYIKSDILGIGIDIPEAPKGNEFRDKFNIQDDFIVYVGRIEESKGCNELFDHFIKYKNSNKDNLKLVLMGKEVMKVPKHKDIISLGFVSEEDKVNGMSAASVLVLPSYYESLSMSVLESLALKVPVLVNGKCTVLKGHCLKSNAGLYYENYSEFEACLKLLINKKDMTSKMSENAIRYINQNYTWENVIKRFCGLIEDI